MENKLYLTSKEMKKLLSISDCQLMHEREMGNLKFIKKGNRFLYDIDDKELVTKHPIAQQVINWYQFKHDVEIDNFPKNDTSIFAIASLLKWILLPIQRELGELVVTYGFVSRELNTYIQKKNPSGTYPAIDQHSSHELKNVDAPICERGGVACDFYVSGFENRMNIVIDFIVNNLEYDKIYYYDKSRPIHVSVSEKMQKHLQIMTISKNGRRIPDRKAYGEKAIELSKELT